MRNPYWEVSRTYIRRLLSSWMVLLYAFVTLVEIGVSLMIWRARMTPELLSVASFMGMAVLFMALVLWAHLHEQIASDRRMLWPNYARPHIVVFIVIAAALTIGWPVSINIMHRMSSVGLLALTTSMFALVGCFAVTGWAPAIFIAVAAQLALMAPSVAEAVFGGQYEHLLGGVLVVALVASALAIIRMLRLKEGDRGYGATIRFDAWSLRPRMTGEVNRAWSLQNRLFRPRSRVYIPTTPGPWERARRWRSLNRNAAGVTFIMPVAIFAAMFLSYGHERLAVQNLMVSPASIYFVMFPLLMVPLSWMSFWRFLETDSLKPMDRRSFFREIGLAMGVQALQSWSILAALFVVVDAWVNQWHVDVISMTALLALWLGVTLCGLAATLWFMRYRLPGGRLGLFAMVSISVMAGVVAVARQTDSRPLMITGAVVSLWLGVLITRSAYRKWLVTELG